MTKCSLGPFVQFCHDMKSVKAHPDVLLWFLLVWLKVTVP